MSFFHTIVNSGVDLRYRYGRLRLARKRASWELDRIVEAGFVDDYIMAYWMFRSCADGKGIAFWGRGAMCSSVICYAIGLTEVDPLRFNLHSERFVNNEPPRFQVDVDAFRMKEFKEEMKSILEENDDYFGIPPKVEGILSETTAMGYLGNKKKKRISRDLNDEMIRYALSFPGTEELLDMYEYREGGVKACGYEPLDEILSDTRGLLVYQEQMLDILKKVFGVPCIEANVIRRFIQRGDEKQVEGYKDRWMSKVKETDRRNAELAWNVLVSNPKAFLKAHAASRVLASHYYNCKI